MEGALLGAARETTGLTEAIAAFQAGILQQGHKRWCLVAKSTQENEAMKTNCKLALAVLAGVLISFVGARLIHGQQVKTPPAYVIAEVEVTDPITLNKYAEKVGQIVASFGGHFVVRGGKIQALEGEAPKGVIVVIGFDSVEKALAWYDSPDYAAIRPFRQSSTKGRMFIVEGVAPQ
jgi:uncharacterized protein (DUF1330 family)